MSWRSIRFEFEKMGNIQKRHMLVKLRQKLQQLLLSNVSERFNSVCCA